MSDRINAIFSKIYKRYDLMNHLFSFGIDILWRDEAARRIVALKPGKVLDLTTGTGDLAIAIWKHAKKENLKTAITATDFNADMLRLAKEKSSRLGIGDIDFGIGDAMKTGYVSGSFDVVSSGFALRNIDDLSVLCAECVRILKPNGQIVFLDMSMPDNPLERAMFSVYSRFMRIIGSLVDKEAYNWLTDSIARFDKKSFMETARGAGFREVESKSLFSGIAYIVTAKK